MEKRSFGLDVLRTVSVWMVLIGHVAYWFEPGVNSLYYSVFKPLLLGVEPFFVLGGFLAAISFNAVIAERGGCVSVGEGVQYVKRRWLRTFPNYFLFLFVYAIAFYLVKPNFEFDFRYLFFAQNLFWLAPNFYSLSWSLAAQEWFYILLPLLIVVLGRGIFKVYRWNPLLMASLGLILLSVVCRAFFLETNTVINLEGELRRIALLRLDSIGMGVLIGYFYFKYTDFFKRSGLWLFIVGILLIVPLAYLRREDFFSGLYWVQMIFYPCFSLSIGLLLPYVYNIERFGPGFFVKMFESSSKWSYSIYLSHVLFLDAIYLLGKKLGLAFTGGPVTLLLIVFWLLITYVSSAYIYKYYEKPWLKLGK